MDHSQGPDIFTSETMLGGYLKNCVSTSKHRERKKITSGASLLMKSMGEQVNYSLANFLNDPSTK